MIQSLEIRTDKQKDETGTGIGTQTETEKDGSFDKKNEEINLTLDDGLPRTDSRSL